VIRLICVLMENRWINVMILLVFAEGETWRNVIKLLVCAEGEQMEKCGDTSCVC